MRTFLPVLASVVTSGLVACASSEGGVDDPRDLLASPQRASIAASESKTNVHASIRRPDGIHGGDASLLVKEGHAVVRMDRGPDRDDRLVLEELRVAYQDVVLPPAYFHDDQVLTGIEVRLERPLEMPARASASGVVWSSGTADLRLDWDLRVDGERYGLAPQTLAGLDVELIVSTPDGALRVDLAVFRDGLMWTWAEDVITLSDAVLVTTAYGGID